MVEAQRLLPGYRVYSLGLFKSGDQGPGSIPISFADPVVISGAPLTITDAAQAGDARMNSFRSNPELNAFLSARDFLLQHRNDYQFVYQKFRWPQLTHFNWALDYFDAHACGNQKAALWIVDENGSELKISYDQMSRRSNQVANFLRRNGVLRGDHIIVMLPNVVAMWEVMLAAMKLGAVVIPTATLLSANDLKDRLVRGRARHVITNAAFTKRFSELAGDYSRVVVDERVRGWADYSDASQH
jgi:acetyl-CoA synthetase